MKTFLIIFFGSFACLSQTTQPPVRDTVYLDVSGTCKLNRIKLLQESNPSRVEFNIIENTKAVFITLTNKDSKDKIEMDKKKFFAVNKNKIIDLQEIDEKGLQQIFIEDIKILDKEIDFYLIKYLKNNVVLEKATVNAKALIEM